MLSTSLTRPFNPVVLLCCLILGFSGLSPDLGWTAERTKASSSKSRVKSTTGKKARSVSAPGQGYRSCIIFNSKTGKIIYSHSPDRQIAPASLTKILSIYVAEDAIRNRKLNRHAKVTVSAKAASAGGSRMGLRTGDRVSLDELIQGMAIASGNDASIALAEYIGGSEQKFVRMMNKKAKAIGMSRSTFKNASGLPAPGQFTTARDMLALAKSYLSAYPRNLKTYHNKSYHTYKGKFSTNANPMLGAFQGADGLKTGYVNASGYNLIATANRNNQRFIGVILGAPTSSIRAIQARSLMEACFTQPSMFADSSKSEKTAVKKTKKQKTHAKKALTANSSQKNGKKKAAVSSKNSSSQKNVASRTAKKASAKKAMTASKTTGKKQVAKSKSAKKSSTTAVNSRKARKNKNTTKVLPSSNPTAANNKTKQKMSNGSEHLTLLPYASL